MFGSLLRQKRPRRHSERRTLLPDTRKTSNAFQDDIVTSEDSQPEGDDRTSDDDGHQPLLPIFSAAHLGKMIISAS
jgi:hypothetical protein